MVVGVCKFYIEKIMRNLKEMSLKLIENKI
jgi:hypothetical protein